MNHKLKDTEEARNAVLNNEVNGKHIRYVQNLNQADMKTLIDAGYGEHFEEVATAPAVVAAVEVVDEKEIPTRKIK